MFAKLSDEADYDANMARKRSHSDFHMKSRRRGREE